MHQSEIQALMLEMHEEEKEVQAAGQKEYAHKDEDGLANFKRVGDQVRCVCEHCGQGTRIGPMATLMVYMLKHVDGIVSYVGGYKSQREDVRGRIKDVRMYNVLLRALIEESDHERAAQAKQEKAQLRSPY